ncbi:MAG: 4Fe-4S dicluster domain-containing protein, partial [Pseudomonadota bacterium]
MTLSEVESVTGEVGDFQVQVIQRPRYVKLDKCIACGECAKKCPKKVPDEYNRGQNQRKSIYIKYAQAVPLKYVIDPDSCIYIQKGRCGACEKVCPADAIDFSDAAKQVSLNVGAIILATGFETVDPARRDALGYCRHPNVLTSMEFERILSSSGPTQGHVVRPSDHKAPQKIAWVQCVGSRSAREDELRPYCSTMCCTQAIKEAGLAKDHVPGLDAAVFYIDIRTMGKYFERYYYRAQKSGVRFIKSRVSSLHPEPGSDRLLIDYTDNGNHRREEFDLVVLSVGMMPSAHNVELTKKFGLTLNEEGFPVTNSLNPVESSRPGILLCGAIEAPKDIPTSV